MKKLDESEIEYAEAKHKELQNIMDKTTLKLTDKENLVEVYKEDLKRYESKTDDEIKTLRYKLNQAYDFMKQFTLGGINMLEKFFQSIGERVQQMMAGKGR